MNQIKNQENKSTPVMDIATEDTINTLRQVSYKRIQVDGIYIFYREAGLKENPAILLLHGFLSSSHMYRRLIDNLSSKYYLVALDYTGFGQSDMPSPSKYTYTFDHLAETILRFTDAIGLSSFSLYMQDYGGPVGFRIASQHPENIESIIVQNANAYNEGLGEALQPPVAYIGEPNETTVQPVKAFMTLAGTQWQYEDGAEDITRIDPSEYIVDQYYLDRPGNLDIQLALVRDYGNNLPLYEVWQSYFRTYQPPTLVISGKNDKLFTAPGAEAFRRDLPDAQIHLLNGGHFVLSEHHREAAELIDTFLTEKVLSL